MSRRSNQWFVPGDGIAREVITADIQRYLGPDALVKPGSGTGENEGVPGYWITAYRTLTTQMIQDLKLDSQRWQAEAGRGSSYVREHKVAKHPDPALVAYKDSRTHESRQYYGPSQSSAAPVEYPQAREPPRASSHQSAGYYEQSPQSAYTHTPQYQTQPSGYTQVPYTQPPRTQPAPYNYSSGGREAYGHSNQQSEYYYSQQPPPEPPRQTQAYAQPSSVPPPGYYIASDGRQYPISQQPQSNTGRPRRT